MVTDQLYCMIQLDEKTSQNDVTSSSNPLFGMLDHFLLGTVLVFNEILRFFPKFWLFLLSQLNSKVRIEKRVSDSVGNQRESLIHGSREDGALGRDEVKMVMGNLGLFCSSESEELKEKYSFGEVSEVFEEEPSLEELKQAFDVFDENRDGFIDETELQRVLRVLGINGAAAERENCQKMIQNFDENGDGRIDFKEFVKIMENSFC